MNMPRIIIYCRSLNLYADLYMGFFVFVFFLGGGGSYYPLDAPQVSKNRLFGMYHANTPLYNKKVIMESMQNVKGVVRVVFATVTLGIGVNCVGLNNIIHYGVPLSIEDYFQESGRAGRSGDPATDVPLRKDLSEPGNAEIAAVQRYHGVL